MKINDFDTQNITKQTTFALWTIACVCIGLAIGGFVTPPPGQIDNSVLKMCAILSGFALLAVVREALKEGRGIKVQHNDTTIELESAEDDKDNN